MNGANRSARERHAELASAYPVPFLAPETLPRYDAASNWERAERNLDYFVAPFIRDWNISALEVGTGHGTLCAALATRGARALGVDTGNFAADWARHSAAFPTASYLRADFLRMPKDVRELDLIVSIGAWEHIWNPISALQTAFERLRPGGLFIAHIGMYFSARGSHLYRKLPYPHPNLLFDDGALCELIGERIPFVNTMTCSHYRDHCERIGFREMMWHELAEPLDEALLQRYRDVFAKYPREDLEVPLLNVVLWKPVPGEPAQYAGLPWRRRGPPEDWRTFVPALLPNRVRSRYFIAESFASASRPKPVLRTRLLDIGAGDGEAAWSLAQTHSVTAIEPSDHLVAKARARSPVTDLRLITGTLPQALYELGNHEFELIVARGEFVHALQATDKHILAWHLARLLVAGGTLVVDDAGDLDDFRPALAEAKLEFIYDGPRLRRAHAAHLGEDIAVLTPVGP